MSDSLYSYKNNELHFLNYNLAKLAKKIKTPCYLYSKKRILNNITSLKQYMPAKTRIHFAMKSNSNKELLKLIKKQKLNIDVVSLGELKRALECGFKSSQIIFSGVAKTKEDIDYSLKKNIFLINIESFVELKRICERARALKKTATISFRINPDVDAHTHPYITTGFHENKFGIDILDLPTLLDFLQENKKHLSLKGLTFHIGSQILEAEPYLESLNKVLPLFDQIKKQGHDLKFLDIGGGYGISYDGGTAFDLKKLADGLKNLATKYDFEFICEPGRFLVGDAGLLLTSVEYVKNTPYKNFVIVNTGMHHLIRPALYNAQHRIYTVVQKQTEEIKADIVGPICESSDWLAKGIKIQRPDEGDILVIADTGAYGFVMASHYNLHPLPQEKFF